MPLLGVFYLLIAVTLGVHAMRTGRPQYWLIILLMVPFVGSIAYVLFELLPELGQSRRARQVAGGIKDLADPDREWRRRYADAQQTDSVSAKTALAEECERKGMWADAAKLYQAAAQGVFAEDPALLCAIARTKLALGEADAALETLDMLRDAHPDIRHSEAHLLYARTLEELGRMTEAKTEYENLSGYATGLEARTRYGLFLIRCGEAETARTVLNGVVNAGDARGAAASETEKYWLKVAKNNL